jgi:hypothetical protein
MQAINKQCGKATVYKTWLDSLTGNHPKYTSSTIRRRHYTDIKANLVICQKGLCAYTEILLDDHTAFGNQHWQNGKFIGNTEIQGQLDHFDATLKTKKGWLWKNFFLVHSSVNNSKLDKAVHAFMKPDSTGYSPLNYLDYNFKLHEFTVSPKITNATKAKQIEYMIKVLGLNYGSIQRVRKKMLNDIFIDYKKGLKTKSQLRTSQFYTAFKIVKSKLP